MPSLERWVGLMAHDFRQTFAGENLFLTRSTRLQGAPTLPSRLLQRLEAALEASGQLLPEPLHWRQWAHQMEITTIFSPESPPAPCPRLDARKESWSARTVTFRLVSVRHRNGIFGAVSPRLRMLVMF
jgi:ATP-dependent helicase/nuclease subunit B